MAIADEFGDQVFYPSQEFKENAHITSMTQYQKMYERSITDPVGFWSEIAQDFYWKTFPDTSRNKFLKTNFDINDGPIEVKWMEGGVTNICYNVVDRIIQNGMGDRVAYIW